MNMKMQEDTRFSTMTWLWRFITQLEVIPNTPGNQFSALSALLLNGFRNFFHQCILDGGENVPLESFEGSHHPVRLLEPRRTVGDVILVTGTPANHHRTSGNELLAFGPLLLNGFWIFFYQRTLGGEENGDGGENVPAHDSSERACGTKEVVEKYTEIPKSWRVDSWFSYHLAVIDSHILLVLLVLIVLHNSGCPNTRLRFCLV